VTISPPRFVVPRAYNAAVDLLERNLSAGRAGKIAIFDDRGSYTYGELAERVNRCANALRGLGLEMEQRVMVALLDGIDYPTVFLGALQAGIVPVCVNTLLPAADYDYMLRDSRARALIVSEALLPVFAPILESRPAHLKHVVVTGKPLDDLLAAASSRCEPAGTTCDDAAFWLYSSGSTGAPKGTVHAHSSPIHTAELYARPVLGFTEEDRVFSAAKLFFAYGLGNALTFPMAVGGQAVLMAERPTPAAVFRRLREQQPSSAASPRSTRHCSRAPTCRARRSST
jgi:benzoate-CoA ligase